MDLIEQRYKTATKNVFDNDKLQAEFKQRKQGNNKKSHDFLN